MHSVQGQSGFVQAVGLLCHPEFTKAPDWGRLSQILDVSQWPLLFELAIAREIRELALKARDKKIAPTEMQGACFTLSNLGGIAGTGFTPIVNPPEVAILGVSPAVMKPVYIDGEFQPRLMLPLSLSYDHRVIDGVAGAMFTRELSNVLNDIRQILL